MIWIWITAAVLLSVFLLRDKNISFENYIWVLLPIDMYGLSFAGVTLKPYMLFSGLLLIRLLMNNGGELFIGNGFGQVGILICFFSLVVNFFNGGTMISIMSILMVIVVYACSLLYVSNIHNSIDEIPEIVIATSIGYGTVFIFAYIMYSMGFNLPGIVSGRTDPGIYMQFSNVYGGKFIQTIRLRGFNIDPNTSVGLFIVAFSVNLVILLLRENKSKRYLISFIISLICIVLTNSRMGILASIIVIIFSARYAIQRMPFDLRRKTILQMVILAAVLLIIFIISEIGETTISSLLRIYGNRSGFNDEYGRGSLWSEAISIWTNKNILLGVGTEQIQFLSTLGRACHNTWLEWLCGCGLVVGGGMIFYFFGLLYSGFKSHDLAIEANGITYHGLLMGLFGMVWVLLTVDNLTNSYLWFLAITLQKELFILDYPDI